ncbi:MAG: 23S rRNA (pseudouridine(1915)-N(3))-methyltransferase RlmH [Pseudohongiellaceae bacterium]
MPAWVQQASGEYVKRLGRELPVNVTEIPLIKRSKSQSVLSYVEKEGEQLLAKVPKGYFLVALEVTGKILGTADLASKIESLSLDGRNLCLLIGGPDGLSESCRRAADELWSLSALTLPHPLVRVIVTEQLYRAQSILKGHPYHRE